MKKKIGLFGFGKTGKAVAYTILQNNAFILEWVIRERTLLDKRNVSEFLGIESEEPALIYSIVNKNIEELLNEHPVDIIVDFSSSSAIYSYGNIASEKGIILISAISHYAEPEIQLLKELSRFTTVFWSPNITLGVNYLLFVAKFLKKIAPEVDIEIIEEHFKGKDGISGTAIKIAEALEIKKEQINSVRAGGIVGKHEVIYGFPFQTMRLIHESISREAFGNGVIFIAKNLLIREKRLYNFEDILLPYFAA